MALSLHQGYRVCPLVSSERTRASITLANDGQEKKIHFFRFFLFSFCRVDRRWQRSTTPSIALERWHWARGCRDSQRHTFHIERSKDVSKLNGIRITAQYFRDALTAAGQRRHRELLVCVIQNSTENKHGAEQKKLSVMVA